MKSATTTTTTTITSTTTSNTKANGSMRVLSPSPSVNAMSSPQTFTPNRSSSFNNGSKSSSDLVKRVKPTGLKSGPDGGLQACASSGDDLDESFETASDTSSASSDEGSTSSSTRPKSARSVRSAVSDSGGPRLSLFDGDRSKARQKLKQNIRESLKKGEFEFLVNMFGYEETIIEFCVVGNVEVVKKMLLGKPEMMVEPDVFIPQPGVLFNETTARSLLRKEYIDALSTFTRAKFEVEVLDALDKGNTDFIGKIPPFRYPEVAKEACRRAQVDIAATVLTKLYLFAPNMVSSKGGIVFGKREPPVAMETFEKAHAKALIDLQIQKNNNGGGATTSNSQCCCIS